MLVSLVRRRDKIQRAVDEGMEQWVALREAERPPVLRELPRPPRLGIDTSRQYALPPPPREEVFEAGFFSTVGRLALWLYGGARLALGVLWDHLRRVDSEERRARRLRNTLEAMGPTFIKFGQQLSMRLDLLPYAYTHELESMLDRVPPMPEEEAIRIVEEATCQPLDATFSAFDRKPIGSASVACVYHAVLVSGEEVAVKVRRPAIGERLAADMRALGWLLKVAELLFLRPGFTANFIFELRTMLMEELDFVREARFGELYRSRMRKVREMRFATAPRVFPEYSCANVLVTEFVTGVWMSEILAALETNDWEAQARLQAAGIDPVVLARRIQLIARYNNFENLFFHADLHPANILVQPGNRIVLIDFGSCGSFDRKELNSWRRWFEAQSVDDVGGMVQASLAIIEPVPPIDKARFAQRLQKVFWDDLYAIKSKKTSHWSERISARLWMGFLQLSREFGMPMRLNTLRMIRASMLADTIAARLDNDQDPYAEYRHYLKGAGRRAKKRFYKKLCRFAFGPSKFIRLEQGLESSLKLFHRIQTMLDSLDFIGILPMIGKVARAAVELFRLLFFIGGIAAAGALVRFLTQPPGESLVENIRAVLNSGWFQLVILVPIIIAIRRIIPYLHDPEYQRPR